MDIYFPLDKNHLKISPKIKMLLLVITLIIYSDLFYKLKTEKY